MTKVSKAKSITVSKEVAKAIEGLLGHVLWGKPEEIMSTHITTGWTSPQRKCLNALSVQDMADILYGGFEVEPSVTFPKVTEIRDSKVEELVGTYKNHRGAGMFTYSDGVKDGIKHTLELLRITVKGINA